MTTGATPLVVISVVNWNTPETTLLCLRALHALDYPDVHIVLIDNASSDDSVARIRRCYPSLTIVQSPTNCGFADGHALGLQQAQSRGAAAIWLINSDAQVDAEALSRLVEAWQRHGDAVYGGAPLSRGSGAAVSLNFPHKYLAERGAPRAFRRDVPTAFDTEWGQRPPLRVGAVSGSCFFLPLELVKAHGWLDSAWFLYCEEIDYCYRLRDRGVPCYLVPKAQVWHHGGGSHRRWSAVDDCIQYYRTRNEIVLAQRHASRWTSWLIAAKKIARGVLAFTTNPRRGRCVLLGVRDALHGRTGKTLSPDDYLRRVSSCARD